jgi:hypothetical protein
VWAVFALGVVLRLPAFGRPLLSDDEAIYATTADAMMRGDRLYRDVVDHKPPLIYHVYQAGFAALGRYQTHGAHALVLLAVLVTAALLAALAGGDDRRRAGTRLAAAALFLIFSTTWHDYDALAANCELFLLVPQAAAGWLVLRRACAPRGKGRELAANLGIGALIGVSALFKYQGLTFLGASVGMLSWSVWRGRLSWPWACAYAACQVVGAALPPALYLLGCVGTGSATATLYWFGFNFSYVGAGLTGLTALTRGLRRLVSIGGVALVPYGLGIAAAFGTAAGIVRELRRGPVPGDEPPPVMVLGLLWLVTSTIALATGGRFFGHYFHLVLAPLCLLAAPAFCRLWNAHRRWRAALVVVCLGPALAFFFLATVGRELAAGWDEREPPYEEAAARIDAWAAPEERVFVWGNSPQLYILARRPMGTRFSFCNYMTGESPGTPTENGQWSAAANELAAAWDMLFADLEQRQPALLVDTAAAGWDGYDKFPLARYPRLRAYVDAHYRPVEVRAGAVLYRRLRAR